MKFYTAIAFFFTLCSLWIVTATPGLTPDTLSHPRANFDSMHTVR